MLNPSASGANNPTAGRRYVVCRNEERATLGSPLGEKDAV